PTNRPMVRDDANDQVYKTKDGKWSAVAREIAARHERQQPVLVGTISVEVSELLSRELTKRGIKHTVLNAKPEHAEREGEIVAEAGQPGAVTIATNMAGRGVDIKLGGNPEHLTQVELRKLGLAPGDPDYEDRFKDILPRMNEQVERDREVVVEAGGLFICGTERHESRRIDNQLRGRSGRQGDPGESRFFLSGQDDLVRLFAGDRIYNILERFGTTSEEGHEEPIEAGILSKQIEKAQRKVEEQNFLIRKRVLEYDDVENSDLNVDPLDRVELIGPLSEASVQLDDRREQELGDEIMRQIERFLLLQIIDNRWREHLYDMDYLREGIHLRGFAQIEPLVAYKNEAFELFTDLMNTIWSDFARMIYNIEVTIEGDGDGNGAYAPTAPRPAGGTS